MPGWFRSESMAAIVAMRTLPPGWKFETKTIDKDLTYIPSESTGYRTQAVSDDLQNFYQGCGFDDACNYIP
jgi:hypothetical protein